MKRNTLFQVIALALFLAVIGCNNSETTTITTDTTTVTTPPAADTTAKDSIRSNPDAMSEPH